MKNKRLKMLCVILIEIIILMIEPIKDIYSYTIGCIIGIVIGWSIFYKKGDKDESKL